MEKRIFKIILLFAFALFIGSQFVACGNSSSSSGGNDGTVTSTCTNGDFCTSSGLSNSTKKFRLQIGNIPSAYILNNSLGDISDTSAYHDLLKEVLWACEYPTGNIFYTVDCGSWERGGMNIELSPADSAGTKYNVNITAFDSQSVYYQVAGGIKMFTINNMPAYSYNSGKGFRIVGDVANTNGKTRRTISFVVNNGLPSSSSSFEMEVKIKDLNSSTYNIVGIGTVQKF